MELASRITLMNSRLVAEISTKHGHDIVSLERLGNRGLPSPKNTTRRTLTCDFADWTESAPDEYALEFGLPREKNLQVFSFQKGKRRFVIPALALMRGLFRPNRDVLPAMFLPHGIERVATPIINNNAIQVATHNWTTSRCEVRESLLQPLAWMYACPSAYRMCGSIHEQAISGRIGMNLPRGRIQFVTHAHDAGQTSFVTSITIISINADETPMPFLDCPTGLVQFHGSESTAVGNGKGRISQDFNIPTSTDGCITLSDGEWAAIRPLIEPRKRPSTCRHDQRALLDGILTKLATGQGWKHVTYLAGSWNNASALHQRLIKRGHWDAIIEVLQRCRAPLNPRSYIAGQGRSASA